MPTKTIHEHLYHSYFRKEREALLQGPGWKLSFSVAPTVTPPFINTETAKLKAIPGIGEFGCAVLLAEIGPIERFLSPKKLVSYAGIAPGLYESGKTSHSRGITHEGNSYLRWILCEMTQVHIRKPGPLRQFFLRLKERIGYTKALVATSRKFLIGIYFVMKGENFAPHLAG